MYINMIGFNQVSTEILVVAVLTALYGHEC